MKPFTTGLMATFLVGLFTAGPAIASDQQEYMPEGSVQQPGAQQQDGNIGQEQQAAVQQLTSEQVRALQGSLQKNGVDPGPVDGILGTRTGKALREFQQEKGLAATGRLNRQTLEALQLEVEEFMGAAPEFGTNPEQQPLQIDRQGALQDDGA
jgi:lysozyme family protein